jgi:hypothetical protein
MPHPVVGISITGLDYFGARYYSGDMGRYINEWHPSSPQSWDLYAYGRNNPLILTDPNGTNCVYNGSGDMLCPAIPTRAE